VLLAHPTTRMIFKWRITLWRQQLVKIISGVTWRHGNSCVPGTRVATCLDENPDRSGRSLIIITC
jgi:hypothetical protein